MITGKTVNRGIKFDSNYTEHGVVNTMFNYSGLALRFDIVASAQLSQFTKFG